MKGEFPFQILNPPPQQNHQNGGCRLKKNSKQEKVSISLSEPLITASLLSGHGLRFEFERAWGHLEAPRYSRPPFPPPALSLSLSPPLRRAYARLTRPSRRFLKFCRRCAGCT